MAVAVSLGDEARVRRVERRCWPCFCSSDGLRDAQCKLNESVCCPTETYHQLENNKNANIYAPCPAISLSSQMVYRGAKCLNSHCTLPIAMPLKKMPQMKKQSRNQKRMLISLTSGVLLFTLVLRNVSVPRCLTGELGSTAVTDGLSRIAGFLALMSKKITECRELTTVAPVFPALRLRRCLEHNRIRCVLSTRSSRSSVFIACTRRSCICS